MVFEQRILIGHDQVIATRGLVLAGLYDRGKRSYVPLDVIFASVGAQGAGTPPIDVAAQTLLELDATMKSDTAA